MQLSRIDLSQLCEYAITAAKQAGELIAGYADKHVTVQHKQGGDSYASQVVTEVDLLSEAIIIKLLQPCCEQYDLAMLTEESEDDKARLLKDYFWCVDPIDGTMSFIESSPGYSVSIALVSRTGIPVIGVIYDPLTQTLFTAVKGQGAFRNQKPWILKSPTEGKCLTLVYDRGFLDKPNYSRIQQALLSMANKHGIQELQELEKNGAVLNACWVLENQPACYFKLPKPAKGGGSLWDFAATATIFHELGAIASDFYGQPLDLNRADSTFMNHRGVIFTTDQSLAFDIQGLLDL